MCGPARARPSPLTGEGGGGGKHTSCYAIRDQTGSTNMAETGKMNSRSLTSYSTSIQYMDLSGIVSRLETTSGFGKTESAEIRRLLVSK